MNVAIVGVGWAGQRHAQAIEELGGEVRVYCLVDNDPKFLQEQATELQVAKCYTDYAAALANPEVDAVSICTPHRLHCPMAVKAMEAGKHVLVEKPMAMTVDEATQMIEVAAERNVKLYIAENETYTPQARQLRAIVQEGQYIGELTSASFSGGFRAPNFNYEGRRTWLARPDLGGTGTWMLHGIHSMATMRFVLGEVKIVYMREHKASSFQRLEIEGTMSGLLTLDSGVSVSVLQTSESKIGAALRGFVLHGDTGSIHAWLDGYRIFNDEHDGIAMSYPEADLSSYAQEIKAFYDYVVVTKEK